MLQECMSPPTGGVAQQGQAWSFSKARPWSPLSKCVLSRSTQEEAEGRGAGLVLFLEVGAHLGKETILNSFFA